ncbi:MAG TPA: prepilin-type N-terminal cleavage/methylation domain-containing protein [Terriglobales bacterium]
MRRQRNSKSIGSRDRQRGFTLVELVVSSAVLLVVTGAVFEQISQMQKRSNAEGLKMDMTQQAREFADQAVRDLHASGYPSTSMYAAQTDNTDPNVAAGLVSVSPTQILMEGAVNGDGVVYSVNISYVPADPSDVTCPCIRRTAVQKIWASPLAQPTTNVYAETSRVLSPGTGPGQSGQDLFAFYDQNGNQIDVSTGPDISTAGGQATISSIKTVKINLSLQADLRVAGSIGMAGASISAIARVGQQ